MDSVGKQSKIVIKPGAVVEFVKTTLRGEITIGKGTVVHPTVQILADGGPIIIGENNLLEERAVIHNPKSESGNERSMVIGDNNVFEVRSTVKARSIGDNNLIQIKAEVGDEVTMGSGCIIGVALNINHRHVPDRHQLYVQDGMIHQRVSQSLPQVQTQQLDYLRNMIPNYHKIYKPSRTQS